MKFYHLVISISALWLSACSGTSSPETSLSAAAFVAKLESSQESQVLDVRSPGEFSGGHLPNAINIDWNDADFAAKTRSLDKNKPVLVYCLSGIRSISAANHLRSEGFSEVYELEGGMMKGLAELPVQSGETKNGGMTVAQYEQQISSPKIVLVDFYADWCAPCKQMEPYLNKISSEMEATVSVVRIDADQNPELCLALGVDALPTLKVYKDNTLVWNQVGFASEEHVRKQLR